MTTCAAGGARAARYFAPPFPAPRPQRARGALRLVGQRPLDRRRRRDAFAITLAARSAGTPVLLNDRACAEMAVMRSP